MRDLLLKNLTCGEKKRKILVSSEIMDKQGVRSIIHRHFVYMVKEIEDKEISKPQPYLYVLKERNNRQQREKFFCRTKGSLYATHQGRLYLILFMHSLKITLMPVPQDTVNITE